MATESSRCMEHSKRRQLTCVG
ncbi:MAG: hypothetical protein GX161_11595 [Firmicutes bacterium]|nr:hypothetical protein [Bacillota bacterium]